MKEKIFAALKIACGNTTSISDKTLDKLAETMAATVKEENQIEAAVELQKPILQAIDGNINYVAAEAVKKVKPAEKPQQQQQQKQDKPADPDEPAWFKTYRESQEARITELNNKIQQREQEAQKAQLMSKLTSKLKEKGLDEVSLPVFTRGITIDSEDKLDEITNSIHKDYTEYVQKNAERGVVISIPPAGGGGVKEGETLAKAIAEKKNSGTTEGVKAKQI